MIKNKRQMFTIIGVFTLMLLLGTTTYAFFNYTRTGSSNTIRVGRISFVTRQLDTINLTNVFPIDKANVDTDTDNVDSVVIEIIGDTDYSEGIEYLVSSKDTNIYTNQGTQVPISLDITIDDDLGTESTNYFTARESKNANIYKKLVGDTLVGDQMLLVGFIKPNTTSGTTEGIDATLSIKAYFDKDKIGISDTYDGTESEIKGTTNEWANGRTILTTTEWNALQTNGVSFKIKVEANEGIWVKGSLEEIMRKDAVMDNVSSTYVSASTGINFGAISSDTNGKGVYMRAGTENDAYPIMYYRGAVEDNNVLFNNQCWKAVRTTDTGGVKLIYNGELQTITTYEHTDLISDSDITYTNDSTYPYIYDGTAKTWTSTNHTDDTTGTITFTVKETGNYRINYELSSEERWDYAKFYKNDTLLKEVSGENSEVVDLGQLATSDVIKVEYTKDDYANSSAGNDNVIFSVANQSGSQTQTASCDNTGEETQISLSGTTKFAFNTRDKSPAYVGYMYGDVYTYSSGAATSGAYYGSGFTYSNGVYTLTNTSTTKDGTHHYTCNSTNTEGTCATIRYYYYNDYYINLTGGDGVEEALAKMNTNTNNSNAKTQIDTWYVSNMNTVTSKLEDTIWCNDRSMGKANGWSATGSWGTDYKDYSILYGAYERSNYASGTSTTKNQPSLACTNKNDAFTVSNGNGNQKLTYPVALLTEDEMVLAGGLAGNQSQFYLNNGSTYYWSLSPANFIGTSAVGFGVSRGNVGTDGVNYSSGLRPSVSLKPGTPVVKGTGTVQDPYVIE